MNHYAGIDVSLEASSVCVIDGSGRIVREAKVANEPEALIAWFGSLGLSLTRIGLEAGPLSQWLYAALRDAGLAVELLETRHVRNAFKIMPVKTDRKDALGVAELMRLGWFRPVHCKSMEAQETRAMPRIRLGVGADRLDDEFLQLDRRHAGDATGVRFAALKEGMGDIVAITNAVPVGVAGRHAIAAVVEDAAHEDGGGVIEAHLSCPGVLCEQSLDSIEGGTIDDRRMLAGMGLPPVDHLDDVEAVLEEMRQRSHAVRTAALGTAAREGLYLRHDVSAGEFLGEGSDRTAFEVKPEHGADRLGLLGYDDQLLVDGGVAERNRSADPQPLALGGRDLVAGPLADDLPLELSEREEHVEGQASSSWRQIGKEPRD
jgi:Transposase